MGKRKVRGMVVLAAVMALLAACGSGGGSTPAETRKMSLAANTEITPWRSGTLAFSVAPVLGQGETMLCAIDDGAQTACAEGSRGGRVDYADLAVGKHMLTVKSGKEGSLSSTTASWEIVDADVVVYGATPGGITSALAAAREGRTVVLLESSSRIGGMMTGGLAKSDVGGAGVKPLGGITREFFDRTRERETALGVCSEDHSCPIHWDFEPHVAGEMFATMLAEQRRIGLQKSVPIVSVVREGTKLVAINTAMGEVKAKVFIDASYEGDLMALAGVSHTLVREKRLSQADGAEPGDIEDDAGYRAYLPPYGLVVDPFVVEGDPHSGLLPFVEPPPEPTPPLGSADDRIMAYNYRLCVTDDPENRVPFAKPAGYDPARYEGSARVALATAAKGVTPLDELYFNPARTVRSKNRVYFKHDLNGGSIFSTDMASLEWNQAYTTADRAGRAAIETAYRNYIAGLLYFWQTDPRFGALNAKLARFGLCSDEFTDNGNWPYRLYVRESRRMVGEYLMNENDLLRNGRRPAITDGIAMGAYSMDTHIRRITWTNRAIDGGPPRPIVVQEGYGAIRLPDLRPYPVAYRSLLPQRAEAVNLLDVVTLSSTSMAYSSLRMEPTFMVIGQAAGTAAAMAAEANASVHDVDVKKLQDRLRADGQVLN